MEKELTCLRSIIADCDERITAALKTRMECIEGIITYKRENGLPVLQPEQEKKQLERVAAEVAVPYLRRKSCISSRALSKTASGFRRKRCLIKISCSSASWAQAKALFPPS